MRIIDLTNQKFGKLSVVSREKNHIQPSGRTDVMWLCQCECGRTVIVSAANLRSGHIKSCGCYRSEIARKKATKHGLRQTRLYKIFYGMKKRCYTPTATSFSNYGGRGITVCEEWQEFMPFYDWAMSHGYSDDLTLERIDNNGNYCPENCRWATKKEQANNRRTNRFITYNGETHTLLEWSNILGVDIKTLHRRLSNGWSVEDALTKAKGERKCPEK